MSIISTTIAGWWSSVRRAATTVVTALTIWWNTRRRFGGVVPFDSWPDWLANVFDPAEYLDGTTAVRIRVEVIPHARDEEFPIRLVLVGDQNDDLAELKFTPARALDAASSIAVLMAEFLPHRDGWRIGDALRTAAIRVWAERN